MLIFLYYFIISKLLAIAAGIYYFRKLYTPYRIALFLTIIALGCEIFGYYLTTSLHRNNLWLFNLYIPVEVWCLGIAAIYLVNNRKIKNTFLVLLIINTLFWVVDLVNHSFYSLTNFAMVSGCILLTTMYITILFTNSIFSNKQTLKQPVFWLCFSTILYFAGVIPLFGLQNLLSTKLLSIGKELRYINIILDIVRYPLAGISFILLGREQIAQAKTV
jgi:hypothetical protein